MSVPYATIKTQLTSPTEKPIVMPLFSLLSPSVVFCDSATAVTRIAVVMLLASEFMGRLVVDSKSSISKALSVAGVSTGIGFTVISQGREE